ncbi:MAG: DnaJ family domain-containing protein [Ilumatobacteraceae bacterium]
MSYIDLIVERQIAEAIARGEMDGGPLKGKPFADVDEIRQPGWWAEQLVRRERSRVINDEAKPEYSTWMRRFWNAADTAAVSRLVADANAWVDLVNGRMIDEDALVRFDEADVIARWRVARRPPLQQPGSEVGLPVEKHRWFRRG